MAAAIAIQLPDDEGVALPCVGENWIADIATERLEQLAENPKTTDTGPSAAGQP